MTSMFILGCGPLVLPIAAIALTVVSIAATAGGAYMQQQAANKAADNEAAVADYNASVAEAERKDALDRGFIDTEAHRTKVRQFMGSQRAAAAGSGLAISGSVAEALDQSAGFGESDALAIRQNSRKDAFGSEVQKNNYLMQASNARARKQSPWISAGISALGSASSFAPYVSGGAGGARPRAS